MSEFAPPAPILQPDMQPGAPFSQVGPAADRDRAGRFVRGNRAALIVGERSVAFWQAAEGQRQAIVAAIVADAGHTSDDAPRALRIAAGGVAQAVLLRDSAFEKLVESGGPLTSAGRARRAFVVWLAAIDRLEKHLRLVGLRRLPKNVNVAAEFAAMHAAEPERCD